MESLVSPQLVDETEASGETTTSGSSSTDRSPAQEQHNFEWVQYGDSTSRRRARAYISRRTRKLKENEEKAKKQKQKAERQVNALVQDVSLTLRTSSEGDDKNDGEEVVNYASILEDVKSTLSRWRVLGAGRYDPFDSLPLKLDARSYALLDHFFFKVAPIKYTFDDRSNFQHVKALSFNVAMEDPAALHGILADGAYDLATLTGKTETEEALRHKYTAITLVNQRLARDKGGADDRNIIATCILAGTELLFGSPQNFSIHMDGLACMVKLRGGIDAIRKSNVQLYYLINWTDYSGACDLLGPRRFAPAPTIKSKKTNSQGVPQELLSSAPERHDLMVWQAWSFSHFLPIASIMRSEKSNADKPKEVATFFTSIDDQLYASLSRPDIVGGKGRRQFIEQGCFIAVLCVATFITRLQPNNPNSNSNSNASLDLFEARLKDKYGKHLWAFGDVQLRVHRLVIEGVELTPAQEMWWLMELVRSIWRYDWEDWRRVKGALMDLFLWDETCAGPLQTIWRLRLGDGDDSDDASTSKRKQHPLSSIDPNAWILD